MAIRCTNCGTVLPNDDAGFCDNCGVSVAPRPAHPGSVATWKGSADSSPENRPTTAQRTSAQEKSRPALREQIAQQPPARPLRLVSPDKSPPATRGESLSAAQKPRAEDLPTTPLAAQLPEKPGTSSATEHAAQHTYQDEVPLFDAAHLAASAQWSPGVPFAPAPPVRQQISAGEARAEQGQQMQGPVTKHPASPFLPAVRRSRPISFLVIIALLCLLIASGLGTWIVLSRPFSVPAVTQPQQSFNDRSLGLSLLYPSGWMTQIDRAKETIHFYDSSYTSEVIITVQDAGSSNVAQYLQQQVVQLGMTGAKAGTPFSFAGASWQRVQGSMQKSGANYTGTILTTIHGNHLLTFIQSAPQSIYADEEKLVFSGMRSSLEFV
ncbi:MAG TPA: hypothetical protein VFA10_05705 [Ktedonobacteraceae bacterium]|nr:hypothetical protein [Ktedonobacteraceae bacterium]